MLGDGTAGTLQQVEGQQQQEDGPGRHLDPPPVEEGEEDHSHDALPGQRRPRALRLGLGEGRTCGGSTKRKQSGTSNQITP